MSGISRLITASRSDVEGRYQIIGIYAFRANKISAANRLNLRKGVLKSKNFYQDQALQPLVFKLSTPESRNNPNALMIVQLPAEVQCMVLNHLEPVRLFQLEEACHEIKLLLASAQASQTWYEALPPPLMVEPERFQIEKDVRNIEAAETNRRDHSNPLVSLSNVDDYASAMPLTVLPRLNPDEASSFKRFTSTGKLIVLPLAESSGLPRYPTSK